MTGVSVVVVLSMAGLAFYSDVDLERYFGALDPILAAAVACALGFFALRVLQNRYFICVIRTRLPARHRVGAGLAAVPFMVAVTWADLALHFPADISVELPVAFVFYPAMGLIAQLLLHVAPFALFLSILSWLFGSWPLRARVWASLVPAACFEAAFQIAPSTSGGAGVLGAFVAAQLFVFGIVELYLLYRQDFLSMVIFRFTYYAYWHFLWGAFRI